MISPVSIVELEDRVVLQFPSALIQSATAKTGSDILFGDMTLMIEDNVFNTNALKEYDIMGWVWEWDIQVQVVLKWLFNAVLRSVSLQNNFIWTPFQNFDLGKNKLTIAHYYPQKYKMYYSGEAPDRIDFKLKDPDAFILGRFSLDAAFAALDSNFTGATWDEATGYMLQRVTGIKRTKRNSF